jgi:biopolymer transport protein ExbD
MVITPTTPQSLDATVPQAASASNSGHALVLSVEETGYALNHTPAATLTEVEERLREAFRTGSVRTVLVQVLGDPSYARVVDALDAATGAGAERLGFLPTNP